MSLRVFTATPTITAGAYASMDAVGGLLEFENVCSAFEPAAEVEAALLIDLAKQNALLHLVLYDREITPTADNAPIDPSDADLAHVIGVITFAAADYNDLNDSSFNWSGILEDPIVLVDGGTSLFGQLYVETSTPTYVTISDLTVKLFIRQ